MPIPINITREHIFQAMLRVQREGIPPQRNAEKYAVFYEGFQYPCKLLISWANVYPNREELDPDPSNFNTYAAQDYLINLDFIVIDI